MLRSTLRGHHQARIGARTLRAYLKDLLLVQIYKSTTNHNLMENLENPQDKLHQV
jgi:hypothetical protein